MDIQKLFEESTGYSTSSWVVFDKELNKYVAIDGELILTVEEMNLDFELFQKGIAIGGQAAKANGVPEISNKIVIGTQVKIINPDDTVEYGVVSGDEGVVVWVGEFGTVFGVCIPKKGDVWSFVSNQLEITSNFSVPETQQALNDRLLVKSIREHVESHIAEISVNDLFDKGWLAAMKCIQNNIDMLEAQEPSHD